MTWPWPAATWPPSESGPRHTESEQLQPPTMSSRGVPDEGPGVGSPLSCHRNEAIRDLSSDHLTSTNARAILAP